MDKLKLQLDSLDDLPEEFHPLYTEKDGKFDLTGVVGMKTQADVDYVKDILTKERDSHKETKGKLAIFSDLNLTSEELHAKLDRFDELELAAADKIDDAKIDEMVEKRLLSKLAPIERERDNAIKERDDGAVLITGFETKDRNRSIDDLVREAATKSKVVETAIADVLTIGRNMFEIDDTGAIVTKDNVGVTPGVDPATWLSDMQQTRPHWWPESQGGGAKGSGGTGAGGNNPFSAANWNMTEQGKMVTSNPTQAENMAKAAGTTIGGKKPVEK